MEDFSRRFEAWWNTLVVWLGSQQFYVQLGAIIAAIGLGLILSLLIRPRLAPRNAAPDAAPLSGVRAFLHQSRSLIWPLLNVLLLGVAAKAATAMVAQDWLVRIAQSLAVVSVMYLFITRFINSSFITALLKWVGIPLATLHVFGRLDEVVRYLDGISIEIGNISLSANDLGRTAFFGALLFWLGRISSSTGKRVIRSRPQLDVGTREVVAKLFEVILFFVLFILLLQVTGIELTTPTSRV